MIRLHNRRTARLWC